MKGTCIFYYKPLSRYSITYILTWASNFLQLPHLEVSIEPQISKST